VSLTGAEMAAVLAPAGSQFIERELGEVRVLGDLASSLPEDGRFDARPDEVIGVDDPDFAVKVNAGWLRMATEFGLLDGQREFLLGVDFNEDLPNWESAEPAWVRVRLVDEWDIAGSGVEQLRSTFASLMTDRYVPEFQVLSCDQRVHTLTTVWGNGTVSTIAGILS
jgi:hypothetical protein